LCAIAHAKPFSSKSGYSIEAPRGWKVTPNFSVADVLIQSPQSNANINVTFAPRKKGETLGSGWKAINAEIRRLKNAKVLGRKKTTLGGTAAVVDEYAYDSPHNGRLRVRQTTAIRGSRAVTVTAMAQEKNWSRVWPAFNRSLASWRWRK
jgi:hypothetical protein